MRIDLFYDYRTLKLEVWIVQPASYSNNPTIMRFAEDGSHYWDEIDEPGASVEPSMSLPTEVATMLAAKLAEQSEHHQHSHDREDYLHERGRVDKLIDAVLESR